MDLLNKLLQWLKPFPFWARVVILVLISAVLALTSLFALNSCGTPKTVATVQNVNPNSAVTVTMTVSNSTSANTSVDATPSLTVPNKN